jgi:hypothetical protein
VLRFGPSWGFLQVGEKRLGLIRDSKVHADMATPPQLVPMLGEL